MGDTVGTSLTREPVLDPLAPSDHAGFWDLHPFSLQHSMILRKKNTHTTIAKTQNTTTVDQTLMFMEGADMETHCRRGTHSIFSWAECVDVDPHLPLRTRVGADALHESASLVIQGDGRGILAYVHDSSPLQKRDP